MGRDIALRFAREGANLVARLRLGGLSGDVAKEVRALVGRAVAAATDISKSRTARAWSAAPRKSSRRRTSW